MPSHTSEWNGEVSATTTICEPAPSPASLDEVHPAARNASFSSPLSNSTHIDAIISASQYHSSSPRSASDHEGKANPASTEVIYVEFAEGDPRNPIKFSSRKKWIITAIACFSTFVSGTTATTFNMGVQSMVLDLNCTQMEALVALGVYTLGFGIVPLITASLSEDFGRQPLHIWSGIGFLVVFSMAALAKNIQTVILARLLQGCFGSTGATMVGGTLSDIWEPHDWIQMNPDLGWRWIQWVQMILCGVYLLLLPCGLAETRSPVLLTKLAKRMRKDTGDARYRARAEDERDSLMHLIYVSCTRPIRLLCTEPVVMSISIWIGFAWGVVFCMVASVTGVFQELHGFSIGQTGFVFSTMTIGSLIGFATNMYQETLYHKYYAKRGPEARLHTTCFAGVLLPVGMLIYAWSSYPHVHWIVQVIGITIFMWGTFVIYLAVFSYLADCYGPYASSALAGQSLARNITAKVFPLFTEQMFHTLGYTWANTLFAILAAVMIPIPFVLYFHGPAIRRSSKFSRMVIEAEATKGKN